MVYKSFAHFYDELMAHAPYDRWIELTESLILQKQDKTKTILDLGCGTGEITLGLAKGSRTVTGVDYSAEMLTVAQVKAQESSKDIKWIQQDIKLLNGFTDVDLIVSYCDVLNYITEIEDVESVFSHVYNSLGELGTFVFDVHHQPFVNNHLINKTFADVNDETSYIWFCYEGEEAGSIEHDITFFVRENGMYKKITEYHEQRIFSLDEYRIALNNAGFNKIKFRVDFDLENENITDEVDRIFIIAEK